MAEWRPGWWARTFGGAGQWQLVIADGRLRIDGETERVDAGVLDVTEIQTDPASKLLTIRITNQPPVALKGAPKRAARQANAALAAQIEDQRRLAELTRLAAAQGDQARLWWSKANEATPRRWLDRETAASIDRDRPDVGAWTAVRDEPRLADFIEGRPEEERAAVAACQTVDISEWAASRNEKFVEWEKAESAEFFQNVEKSPLTDEQVRATICFDNRVRVIASAGSGKTSTMVARAGYAVRRGIAEPQEILMLAFNKKAAGELSERAASRLGEPGTAIASSTFHAFGLRVIGEATGRKPSVPDDLAGGDGGAGRLSRIVDGLRDSDPGFRRDWDLFRLVFGRSLPDLGDESDPEAADRRSGAQGFKTLAGEVVKSQEEVMIANWLFYNGVKYEYERPYEHDVADAHHRQYQPDFYYPGIDAYHEHWALGADGNPPPHFEGYADSMTWRRQTHADNGTRLIETTSATIRNGSGFEHLEQELRSLGVELDENPYREAPGEPPIKDETLKQLLRAFMVNVKGNRLTGDELERRVGTAQLRDKLFLRLFSTILDAWDRDLRAHDQIDFEDMLNLAADHIEAGRWTSPYRLVMVDEMQDVSAARAALVRALLKRPGGAYLYAVGDDWQSINRFAGSDLSVLTRFPDWFGEGETVWLNRTFRSPQSLCDVAGSFVMRNEAQLKKDIRSSAAEPGESLLAAGVDRRSDYDGVVAKYLDRLDRQAGSPATVLILSRYRRDRQDIASALATRFAHLTVEFNTVHGSKGKEADYVIVLGLESRKFPSTIEDDPLLELAKAAPDPYPHAEERRLFYVALTRARRSVLLLTVNGNESPFLLELIRGGAVRVRSLKGADITPEVCPRCQKRTLRRRSGKYGPFLGCSGYPLCKGRVDLPSDQGKSALGGQKAKSGRSVRSR